MSVKENRSLWKLKVLGKNDRFVVVRDSTTKIQEINVFIVYEIEFLLAQYCKNRSHVIYTRKVAVQTTITK